MSWDTNNIAMCMMQHKVIMPIFSQWPDCDSDSGVTLDSCTFRNLFSQKEYVPSKHFLVCYIVNCYGCCRPAGGWLKGLVWVKSISLPFGLQATYQSLFPYEKGHRTFKCCENQSDSSIATASTPKCYCLMFSTLRGTGTRDFDLKQYDKHKHLQSFCMGFCAGITPIMSFVIISINY